MKPWARAICLIVTDFLPLRWLLGPPGFPPDVPAPVPNPRGPEKGAKHGGCRRLCQACPPLHPPRLLSEIRNPSQRGSKLALLLKFIDQIFFLPSSYFYLFLLFHTLFFIYTCNKYNKSYPFKIDFYFPFFSIFVYSSSFFYFPFSFSPEVKKGLTRIVQNSETLFGIIPFFFLLSHTLLSSF